ncbi:hypothetical protein ACA29_14425 [Lederbergia galactosidilytica]|uniref:Uncharacterized protein n=1 Tax=Lederbergia galactosidilytica TaxID=217031 RepID=A0A0Q9XUC1_9BACI|nr:hypothetical protein ACA29_14425 [Lederbergia galactosidilytica]
MADYDNTNNEGFGNLGRSFSYIEGELYDGYRITAAYLIAYFRSGPMQTNKNERLHYAYSRDGLHWYELNQNHAVWSTSIGEGILRDPFINKGKDGFWHLVFTIRPKGKFLGYAC